MGAMRFTDRTAIVTGAASGIGQGLAEELAARGVHVVLTDRQVELADEVCDGIREAGGSASVVELDVRDTERFAEVAAEVLEEHGVIDYLFNNAGFAVGGEARDFEPADWYDVFDVNLRGVTNGIMAVYFAMCERGQGHVVNISSMAALGSMAGSSNYCATKWAVVGLSKSIRIEAKRHGVKVSVVCPGVIRTQILKGGVYGRSEVDLDTPEIQQQWEKARPMEPRDFARRVMKAVDRNKALIIVPGWWKIFWYMERLSPGLNEWLSDKAWRKMAEDFEARKSK